MLLLPIQKAQEHGVSGKNFMLVLDINLILSPLKTVLKYGFSRKMTLTLLIVTYACFPKPIFLGISLKTSPLSKITLGISQKPL